MDVLVGAGLAESNADAKRKIKQGGVFINDKKVTDIGTTIIDEMNDKILKAGKRKFRRLVGDDCKL